MSVDELVLILQKHQDEVRAMLLKHKQEILTLFIDIKGKSREVAEKILAEHEADVLLIRGE